MGNFVPFTTSWDDGFPADTRVADLLHSFGLRGTFYASTGPAGARSISDSDLRRIARDHELGNHGRTHTPFLSLSSADIEDEVRWGDRELSRFGSPGKIVAPPKGKMDSRVVRTLRELGYQVRSAPVLATRSRRATWFEPSLQFYPHTWSAITRNMARRRLLPAAPLLLTWARGGTSGNEPLTSCGSRRSVSPAFTVGTLVGDRSAGPLGRPRGSVPSGSLSARPAGHE